MKVRIGSWAFFDKTELPLEVRKYCEKALTLTPIARHAQAVPTPLYLWESTAAYFGVPRYFFLGRTRRDHIVYDDTLCVPRSEPLSFNGELRPDQQEAVSEVLKALEADSYGGIIKAPTAFGKTVLACYLIAKLGLPTVVFVNRDPLVGQWIAEIRKFLPGATIGVVQGPRCEFEGCDVVVAMLQSVARPGKYPTEFFNYPSMVLFDEVHRLSAPTFSKIPPLFPARYRIGLSATPRRKDGTENVFFWHLGPMLYTGSVPTLKPLIKRVWTNFVFPYQRIDENRLLKSMTVSAPRNRAIVDQIVAASKVGRKIIVFSKRRKHLSVLAALLEDICVRTEQPVPSMGFCVGGTKEDDLALAKTCQVLFATYHYAAEAFNVPALDTLIMATPIIDMEQTAGRILRPFKSKSTPVIVDFRDDSVSMCASWAEKRDRFYSTIC